MDKKIVENIIKVPFLNVKLATIENLLANKKMQEAYKAVAALIEIVCIICLDKVHHKTTNQSDIVMLASLLENCDEKEMKELLVEINGEYEDICLRRSNRVRYFRIIRRFRQFSKNCFR